MKLVEINMQPTFSETQNRDSMQFNSYTVYLPFLASDATSWFLVESSSSFN